MRRITDHRLEERGFNESIQALVRGSPWWAISLVIHAIAGLILWNIPVPMKDPGNPSHIQAVLPEGKQGHYWPETTG